MLIGDVIKLTTVEERIVKFIAIKRQQNKEITGIDGKGQANNKKGIRNNKLGFAGEFLFCKSFNLFSDFTINNTSKIKKTDNGDAILKGYTVDVKTSQNKKYLMTPSYSKSNIDLFAKFYLDNKGKFIFQGFATNKMLFNIENLQKEKEKNYLLVDSYVLETSKLLNFTDIINQNQKTNKMSELKITGNITKVLELQKGVSKATGKEWQKLNFLVQTDEQYNNYYYFEIFGEAQVENFNKWNSKIGSKVTVKFNVKTNEYNGKYYTTLAAYNVFNEFSDAKTEAEKISVKPVLEPEESEDDLPF